VPKKANSIRKLVLEMAAANGYSGDEDSTRHATIASWLMTWNLWRRCRAAGEPSRNPPVLDERLEI